MEQLTNKTSVLNISLFLSSRVENSNTPKPFTSGADNHRVVTFIESKEADNPQTNRIKLTL